jgi:hypothetical protein
VWDSCNPAKCLYVEVHEGHLAHIAIKIAVSLPAAINGDLHLKELYTWIVQVVKLSLLSKGSKNF